MRTILYASVCFAIMTSGTAIATNECLGPACYASSSYDNGPSGCDSGPAAHERHHAVTAPGATLRVDNGCASGASPEGEGEDSYVDAIGNFETPVGGEGAGVSWFGDRYVPRDGEAQERCTLQAWPLLFILYDACPNGEWPPYLLP